MASGAKGTALLVATRKGAFVLTPGSDRRKFVLEGPHLLGSIIHHMVLDPRDGRTLLMAASTGHLGPTIFRSTDRGATWKEATRPPAFPKVEGPGGRAVDHTFWLAAGHRDQPGIWWAGTSPPGLFRSADAGATWEGIEGFNEGLISRIASTIGPVPDGPITHSVLIDPVDPMHMYAGISTGGFFESIDGGGSWTALNKGVAADFLPESDPEFGHDPHTVVIHPARHDRLYQQNHCGIYRLDRPAVTWERIGLNMPKEVGDIGFPLVPHPRDPDSVWVIPMDGTTVWPRTSVDGRPAVYRTSDAGKSWRRLDRGLPPSQAWHTVKRQAFAADARDPVGLYFGTTSGEIWASADEGESWTQVTAHLPPIFSVTTAEFTA